MDEIGSFWNRGRENRICFGSLCYQLQLVVTFLVSSAADCCRFSRFLSLREGVCQNEIIEVSDLIFSVVNAFRIPETPPFSTEVSLKGEAKAIDDNWVNTFVISAF